MKRYLLLTVCLLTVCIFKIDAKVNQWGNPVLAQIKKDADIIDSHTPLGNDQLNIRRVYYDESTNLLEFYLDYYNTESYWVETTELEDYEYKRLAQVHLPDFAKIICAAVLWEKCVPKDMRKWLKIAVEDTGLRFKFVYRTNLNAILIEHVFDVNDTYNIITIPEASIISFQVNLNSAAFVGLTNEYLHLKSGNTQSQQRNNQYGQSNNSGQSSYTYRGKIGNSSITMVLNPYTAEDEVAGSYTYNNSRVTTRFTLVIRERSGNRLVVSEHRPSDGFQSGYFEGNLSNGGSTYSGNFYNSEGKGFVFTLYRD